MNLLGSVLPLLFVEYIKFSVGPLHEETSVEFTHKKLSLTML